MNTNVNANEADRSACSEAPVAGWKSPYIIALLVLSIVSLAAFAYWEIYVAQEPILPFNIWKSPSFGRLMLTIFFAFMSLGIFFWYMNMYMQTIRHDSLIRTGIQYLPLTIVGAANSFLSAWLVTRVPAQIIIGAGCVAMITINVLLSTIPAHLTYWAMAFPAMFFSAFTIDLIVTSAQIIANNTVSIKHQGVAGSLVGYLFSYRPCPSQCADLCTVSTFFSTANAVMVAKSEILYSRFR